MVKIPVESYTQADRIKDNTHQARHLRAKVSKSSSTIPEDGDSRPFGELAGGESVRDALFAGWMRVALGDRDEGLGDKRGCSSLSYGDVIDEADGKS